MAESHNKSKQSSDEAAWLASYITWKRGVYRSEFQMGHGPNIEETGESKPGIPRLLLTLDVFFIVNNFDFISENHTHPCRRFSPPHYVLKTFGFKTRDREI